MYRCIMAASERVGCGSLPHPTLWTDTNYSCLCFFQGSDTLLLHCPPPSKRDWSGREWPSSGPVTSVIGPRTVSILVRANDKTALSPPKVSLFVYHSESRKGTGEQRAHHEPVWTQTRRQSHRDRQTGGRTDPGSRHGLNPDPEVLDTPPKR